jgi:hypothetical protein
LTGNLSPEEQTIVSSVVQKADEIAAKNAAEAAQQIA